jgi:PAS domain S-box-containing protein
LPVHEEGRVVGALTLYAAEPGAFDPEQIGLLEALSADVSYALDAMRLEKLRAEAEQSLRESELRFRTLADAMPQLAWTARPDGWIYWYNVRWYEYTGTTPQQMEGWGWQSVHDPQVLPAVMERWKTTLATGEPFDMTFPLRGADGVFRPFLTRVMPLKDAQGRVVQWFGTNTDVSTQKAIEEALAAAKASAERAKAAAEDASRAKDHFLAVLSHELRTPLTPVLAAASMLQREAGLSAEVRDDLEMIRRNAELEARLIDDLLDLTRIARGKVALNRRPVELVTVLSRAVEVCRPDMGARQLRFAFDANCQGAVVDADAARLQQVFWNILKNAIKFTPKKGWIVARCWVEEGRAVVEIRDSGIGIEAEALPRVFSAFEQAGRAITRQFGGLGLGLAISKALVEMHGGTIAARSAGKNRGATFTVELPVIGAEASEILPAREQQEKPSEERPPRRRIMLVEDHADTARIMAHMLRQIGFEVRTVEDVSSALEQLAQEPCDLLISDLGLPDGSGLDLMKALRARGDTVPGIALSGYGQEEDVRRSHEAGFAEHVTKPVELDQLASAIAAVLQARIDMPGRG